MCEEERQFVLNLNITQDLIDLLSVKELSIIKALLRVFGILALGGEDTVSRFCNQDFADKIINLLHSTSKLIKLEACWIITNCIATGPEYYAIFYSLQLIDTITVIALTDMSPNTAAEALQCIHTFISGATVNILEDIIIENRLIDTLLACLKRAMDNIVLGVLACFEGIFSRYEKLDSPSDKIPVCNLIVESGMSQNLFNLQFSKNPAISTSVTFLINHYLSEAEEDNYN